MQSGLTVSWKETGLTTEMSQIKVNWQMLQLIWIEAVLQRCR